jgi:Ca2+-binding RTX toxin-like protein
VDNANDRILEFFGEGSDTVFSSIAYTLSENLENLVLTGTAGIRGSGNSASNIITGNEGDNALSGGDGNDVLNGGAGNDVLDGGAGTDTLVGGVGNDLYIINDSTDTISEDVGGGTDTVLSSSSYSLGANVETLVLATGAGDINGTGNNSNNVINGNEGSNILSGGAGNDTLNGGAGNDLLDGNTGADTLSGGAGDDTFMVDDSGDVINEAANGGTDIAFSMAASYSLAPNVETLTLLGSGNSSGTGNAGDNTLNGNSGSNILDGGAGNDTINGGAGNDALNGGSGNDLLDGGVGSDALRGGLGNDTYLIDSVTDTAIDEANGGFDTVFASVSFTLANGSNIESISLTGSANLNAGGSDGDNLVTGNAGNNTLTGGAGNDILNGGGGTDTLIGGVGNDTYIVDDPTDTIIELAGAGSDTVLANSTYTLGANLENLVLVPDAGDIDGIGNALNNTITGNEGNNLLDGRGGIDRLIGGAGNDTYVVDNTSDVVVETPDNGIDTVNSSVNYTLGSNVENLILTPGAGSINGTGNGGNNTITGNEGNNILSGAAGDDTLQGGAGNDTLDGGLGTDILTGGAGNDTYVVDSEADVVNESDPAGGTADTVRASISYTIGANIETLELTGTAIVGAGNAGNNTLIGNAGDNILNGLGGTDLLIGGAGNDVYFVETGILSKKTQTAASTRSTRMATTASVPIRKTWF